MNNVTLLGRLGQDPELKTSNNDKSFATFSIATNDGYGDNKKTNWHNCICFGKVAEIIDEYTNKGDNLCVSGSVEYTKKDDKIYTNIVVQNFSFVGGGENKTQSQAQDNSSDEDEDLPY